MFLNSFIPRRIARGIRNQIKMFPGSNLFRNIPQKLIGASKIHNILTVSELTSPRKAQFSPYSWPQVAQWHVSDIPRGKSWVRIPAWRTPRRLTREEISRWRVTWMLPVRVLCERFTVAVWRAQQAVRANRWDPGCPRHRERSRYNPPQGGCHESGVCNRR